MGQEQQRVKDEDATGRDLPNADGTVSPEDVNAIDNDGSDKPIGQDHSTEDRGRTTPEGGVGNVQDSSDTTADAARLEDQERANHKGYQ